MFIRLGWPFHCICCYKTDTAQEIAYFFTQLLREDILYFEFCRKRRRAILRIEALRHQITTQDQHRRFVGGEAERWQEIPFHQGVAQARNRNDWHTSLP